MEILTLEQFPLISDLRIVNTLFDVADEVDAKIQIENLKCASMALVYLDNNQGMSFDKWVKSEKMSRKVWVECGKKFDPVIYTKSEMSPGTFLVKRWMSYDL
jgi:hypothetical protein